MCRQIVTYKANGKEEEGYLISAAHAQQHIGGSNIPRTYTVLVVNEKGTDKLKTIPLVDVKSFRFEEDPEKEEIRENFKKELEDIENYKIRKITDKEDSNYKKLFATKFFVEATSEERSVLWVKYSKSWQKHSNDYPDYKKLDWEEDRSGFGIHIGNLRSRGETLPVYISFSFDKIEGKQVCFYSSDSLATDHKMVEDFITTNFPVKYDSGSMRAMTNATNFHHCVGFCEDGD